MTPAEPAIGLVGVAKEEGGEEMDRDNKQLLLNFRGIEFQPLLCHSV